MEVRIIQSGSDGNCTIVKDCQGEELMLDCGLPYDTIVKGCDMGRVNAIFATHHHKDHYLSYEKLKSFYFPCFTTEEFEKTNRIDLLHWVVVPVKLVHNVECYGLLIYSKNEKKRISYMTDTTYLPKMLDVDMFIIDCNYDEDIVFERLSNSSEKVNLGYRNHCSTQKIKKYIQSLGYSVRILVAYHISNSHLQDIEKIKKELSPLVERLYIAEPNTIIRF